MKATTAFYLLSTSCLAMGASYNISDTVVGPSFYTAFTFLSGADPSHGRVTYVNKTVAQALNITYATNDTFILRGEFKTTLNATGPGRSSVRLKSVKQYTTHVAVFDVRHMPQGCATWPAIWETNESNWPNGGEVDIMEGVNSQGRNVVSLHTSAGCTMPATTNQTGTTVTTECNTLVNGAGCGVRMDSPLSFGPNFNNNKGGWYAIERTTGFIKVWFWARNATGVPTDVRNGPAAINTGNWGTPQAFFPGTNCNMTTHFNQNNVIINLTFCGDYAGQSSVYAASGCPSTCVDVVNNNPGSFGDAYFNLASMKVYI